MPYSNWNESLLQLSCLYNSGRRLKSAIRRVCQWFQIDWRCGMTKIRFQWLFPHFHSRSVFVIIQLKIILQPTVTDDWLNGLKKMKKSRVDKTIIITQPGSSKKKQKQEKSSYHQMYSSCSHLRVGQLPHPFSNSFTLVMLFKEMRLYRLWWEKDMISLCKSMGVVFV